MVKPNETATAKATPAKASGPSLSKKAKTKAPAAAAASTKTFPPGFRGCKTCGGTDHRRCTKHKCPKHPDYDPPKPKLHRSDSYECPSSYYYDRYIEGGGEGGDWSGMPGHRCQLCGRSSENVGPRRGFDYSEDVCGGCADLE